MARSTASTNEKLVLEYFTRGWQEHDFDRDLVADDYVVHDLSGGASEMTIDERIAGHEADLEAFPDLAKEPVDVVVEDDTVVVRYRATGTHEGEFRGHPPTGRSFEIYGVATFRVEDGRIAESWYVGDHLGLLQQLGVVDLEG